MCAPTMRVAHAKRVNQFLLQSHSDLASTAVVRAFDRESTCPPINVSHAKGADAKTPYPNASRVLEHLARRQRNDN